MADIAILSAVDAPRVVVALVTELTYGATHSNTSIRLVQPHR
jgi:hypothetical protein